MNWEVQTRLGTEVHRCKDQRVCVDQRRTIDFFHQTLDCCDQSCHNFHLGDFRWLAQICLCNHHQFHCSLRHPEKDQGHPEVVTILIWCKFFLSLASFIQEERIILNDKQASQEKILQSVLEKESRDKTHMQRMEKLKA